MHVFRAVTELCLTGIARRHYTFHKPDTKKTLVFKREPSNKYDPNCIQVWLDNKHIGWIKKEDAVIVAPVMDKHNVTITRWSVYKKTSGYLIIHVDMKIDK